MTNVVLPKLNQTGANEWVDVQDNDEALKKVINGELDNGNLSVSAGIVGSKLANETIGNTQLAPAAKPFDWYAPKIIAGEEGRINSSFGTLPTPDEIKNVVLPENGLIGIGYVAKVKSQVANAGRAAIFIGSNQLKSLNDASALEQEISGEGVYRTLSTSASQLAVSAGETPFVTTGQPVAVTPGNSGGICWVSAAAGTYNISIQYRATSSQVLAMSRKLWVFVLGV